MNPWEQLSRLPKDPDERMKELARFYQSVFSAADARLLLEDLKVQFFFYDTTADERPRMADLKEGNRQVVLYILKALSVDTTPQAIQPQGE